MAFSLATTIAALAFGLPAPHTVAAAALALTTLLCASRCRHVLESIVRRESRGD